MRFSVESLALNRYEPTQSSNRLPNTLSLIRLIFVYSMRTLHTHPNTQIFANARKNVRCYSPSLCSHLSGVALSRVGSLVGLLPFGFHPSSSSAIRLQRYLVNLFLFVFIFFNKSIFLYQSLFQLKNFKKMKIFVEINPFEFPLLSNLGTFYIFMEKFSMIKKRWKSDLQY